MPKIAVFPGSFDPIHLGHLKMAQVIAETHERVYLVPSGISPNKAHRRQTPSLLRADWIELTLQNPENSAHGKIRLSRIEAIQNRRTYTLDTLIAIQNLHPKTELSLICGADTAARIERWPSRDRIHQLAKLLILPRNGEPGTLPLPEITISSSLVRSRIAEAQPVAHLVPQEILPWVLDAYAPKDTASHTKKLADAGAPREAQLLHEIRQKKDEKREKIDSLIQETLGS